MYISVCVHLYIYIYTFSPSLCHHQGMMYYKSDVTFACTLLLCKKKSIWAVGTWEINNYGKYINQFPPNTIKSIRQYERINKKICRQKMSIIFNEIYIYVYIYIHAHTHTHTHTHIYIYIYIYIYIWFLNLKLKKIGLSSHKMYSNNILNFQECTTILNACTKMFGNLLNAPRIYIYTCVCVCVYLPTPPLGQDMTQGQFLSGVHQVWIQSFPSPWLVASPRLKNLVCPTLYP